MDNRILVVDDEMHIVELLKFNLEVNGYNVDYSQDGFEAYHKAKEFKPNLILLDWMLPNISGMDVLKKIKNDEELKDTPIIMLTAKNMERDKVRGLDEGADDYITKPFGVKELLARINSVLRRYNLTVNKVEEILSVKDIKMDLIKHEVTKKGQKIDLTIKEFDLLKLLLQNRGKVLSRNFLLDKVWGYEYFGETRTVDVHVRYLRKKIENDGEKYIETIRGIGYKIN